MGGGVKTVDPLVGRRCVGKSARGLILRRLMLQRRSYHCAYMLDVSLTPWPKSDTAYVPLPLITLLNLAPIVAHDHLGGLVPHLLRDEQGIFAARNNWLA